MGLLDDEEFVELAAPPDRMLIVEDFTSLAYIGVALGTNLQQPMVLLTFDGHINNTNERASFSVAIDPVDVGRVIIPRLNQRVSQVLRWIQRNRK